MARERRIFRDCLMSYGSVLMRRGNDSKRAKAKRESEQELDRTMDEWDPKRQRLLVEMVDKKSGSGPSCKETLLRRKP